MTILIFLM